MALLDPPSRSFYAKLVERMFFAGVWAGLATLTVNDLPWVSDHLPAWAVVFVAPVFSAVKGYVSRRVGDTNDPAALPAGV